MCFEFWFDAISKHRILFTLREKGKTQKEIADQLGYKTYSAVSKYLQTMRGQLEDYMRTQQ